MRPEVKMMAVALLAATAACANETALEPARAPALPEAALKVPPASRYSVTAYPVDGWFADVNDQNLVVGMGNGQAIALPWNGTLTYMSSGPGLIAQALAVNTHGVIAGLISPNCCAWTDLRPAVWKDYQASPIVFPDTGQAVDVNDQGEVVGSVVRRGQVRAFVWDLATGTMVLLPPLPRGRSTTARAINNDRIILGTSDDGRGNQVTVVWRVGATGWTPQVVTGGIDGQDLDAAMGIVGATANRASFGKPDHAGWFNTIGVSVAEGVSSNGVLAVGTDAGAGAGWPQGSVGFIADQNGNTTYLPWPAAGTWRDSFGKAVTNCGLVVGTMYPLTSGSQPYTAQPTVWDPGC